MVSGLQTSWILCTYWRNAWSTHFPLRWGTHGSSLSLPCFGSPCSPSPMGVIASAQESHVGEQRQPACSHSWTQQCDILCGSSHREQPAPGGAVGFWDLLSRFVYSVSHFVQCSTQNAGKETHAREKKEWRWLRSNKSIVGPLCTYKTIWVVAHQEKRCID